MPPDGGLGEIGILDAAGGLFKSLSKGQGESAKFKAAYQSYMDKIKRGQADEASGEKSLLDETSGSSPELDALKNSIATNSTVAQQNQLGQTNAALSQQGVRGPRAATIMGRAAGDLNRNLNADLTDKTYQEYVRKNNIRTGYFSNKAKAGQGATYATMGT